MRIFRHYISWNVLFLLIAETGIIFGSVYAGLAVKFFGYQSPWLGFEPVYPKAITFVFVSVITLYVANLYDLSLSRRKRELLVTIAACFLVIAAIIAAINFLIPYLRLSRTAYLLALLLSLPAVIGFRLFYYWAINLGKMQGRVLILGATAIARRIFEEFQRGNNPGFEILGLVAENGPDLQEKSPDLKLLGCLKDLDSIIREYRPNIVVVALSERRGAFPFREILDCKLRGVRVEDWPTFYEKLTGKILIQNLRPSWLIFCDGFTRNELVRTAKRLGDVLLSTLGLCVSFPLMVCIALLTRLDSAGPILFRQERVGEHGKIFILCKFRTMVTDAEKETGPVWAQTTDPRVTRLGKILRRTGMDEIPQMFNVLKGDMSFVGPRPERPHFVAELQQKIPYYAQRLTVKPGITGWAQVRYGYGATLEDAIEKLQYDLYYIKNLSPFLDLLIMLSTVHKMLFARVAMQSRPPTPVGAPHPQPDVALQSPVGSLSHPEAVTSSQEPEARMSAY